MTSRRGVRPNFNNKGFTLLEIILVLALIGAIAGVILPNLHVTFESQMSVSIKNLSGQIRAAYDNAIFSGRLQRMVVNIKTSEYWVEQAPSNFKGRPPLFTDVKSEVNIDENNRKNFLEKMEEKEKNQYHRQSPYSSEDNPIYYTIRSIPIIQKNVFLPIKWLEVSDSIISKQKLVGSVVFAKFISGLSKEVYEYSNIAISTNNTENVYCYIYFFSDGTATPTSIQLGIKTTANLISEDDAKYTLNLNTLTGQSYLLEGFQDANFTLPKK